MHLAVLIYKDLIAKANYAVSRGRQGYCKGNILRGYFSKLNIAKKGNKRSIQVFFINILNKFYISKIIIKEEQQADSKIQQADKVNRYAQAAAIVAYKEAKEIGRAHV